MTGYSSSDDFIDQVQEGEDLLTMGGMPFRIMEEPEIQKVIATFPRRQTHSLAARVREQMNKIPLPTAPGRDTGGVFGPFKTKDEAEKVRKAAANAISTLRWKRKSNGGRARQAAMIAIVPTRDERFAVSVIRLAPEPGEIVQ